METDVYWLHLETLVQMYTDVDLYMCKHNPGPKHRCPNKHKNYTLLGIDVPTNIKSAFCI